MAIASVLRSGVVVVLALLASAAQAGDPSPLPAANPVSINSTSQGRPGGPIASLPLQPFTKDARYQLVVANDLGMHCGDLDDRIATILPPYNVVHAQVLKRGYGR